MNKETLQTEIKKTQKEIEASQKRLEELKKQLVDADKIKEFEVGDVFVGENIFNIIIAQTPYADGGRYILLGRGHGICPYGNPFMNRQEMLGYLNAQNAKKVGNINQTVSDYIDSVTKTK